mgnify:CR=1 FL=1
MSKVFFFLSLMPAVRDCPLARTKSQTSPSGGIQKPAPVNEAGFAFILSTDNKFALAGGCLLSKTKSETSSSGAFSGHADYKEMIQFLKCQDASKVQRTFIVHGDYTAQQFYKGELEKVGYKNITIPDMGEEVEI